MITGFSLPCFFPFCLSRCLIHCIRNEIAKQKCKGRKESHKYT
jgi:hypothetical protein